MKKILKIAGIVIITILLLLILSPLLFKDKITNEIKRTASRTLNTGVDFRDVSLSFFSHFPYLTLTLTDFILKGSAPYQQDTLVSAAKLGLGVDIMSLFSDTISVSRVFADGALIKIMYNDSGQANYMVYNESDTTLDTPADTASAGASLNIEHISLTRSRLVYADEAIPFKIELKGFDYKGKSIVTSDFFDITSGLQADAFDLTYDGEKYIDGKPVTAKANTRINSRDFTIFFEKNDLKIKDIPLQFNGKFNFEKDGYALNMTFLSIMEREFFSARVRIRQGERMWFSARANASVDLQKWIQAMDYREVELRGNYDLNMTAEGYYATGPVKKGPRGEVDTVILSIPRFDLKTKLTNGYLKFSQLPKPLNTLSFNLNASCPDSNYKNITVNLDSLYATFLKNEIKGYFRLKEIEDLLLDARLAANVNLSELREVFPMDSLDLRGMIGMDIDIKGNYAPEKKMFPVTNARIKLSEGLVKTAYYPHPLEKVTMDMTMTSSKGSLQDLAVKIDPLTLEFEGKPFVLNADLRNFEDISYHLRSKGVLDLGKIYKVFSQEGLDLEGYIETDLALKGKQSDAVEGRLARLDNRGTLKLRQIALRSADFPRPFIISDGYFRFVQDRIVFEDFKASYGRSDFNLKGDVRNILSYMLDGEKPLKGDFTLSSKFIDVDEFSYYASTGPENSTPSQAGSGVVIIPRDLDIDFRADIGKVAFSGLDIRDLHGEIDLDQGILVLSGAGFNLIGCKVAMDATYGSISPQKAHFDFKVKAEDFDIRRAYNEIALIRELATSAGKAEGTVSLDYSLKGILDANMYPIMPSLEGGGTLSVKKVKVSGLKLFNDISKSTEREGLGNPDLSKVEIKSTIDNNIMTLEQFRFKVSGIRFRISGSTTLDGILNLRIRLGLPPMGIFGIPMMVTGPMENLKIKYGKGKDAENLPESEFSEELPAEMLDRIKHAKDDGEDGD